MHLKSLLVIIMVMVCSSCDQKIKVINGHAHNDYENENPLYDAINNGFSSVEVDVHLVDGDLYVSHDFPEELNPALTLQNLYLDPLKEHISKNRGSVYRQSSSPFYLMIDFKSSANQSYEKLKMILSDYLSIITVIQNGIEKKGAVKILITGNRPIDEVIGDEPKLVGIDGRPSNLGKDIPLATMPLISDHFGNYLSWTGSGELNDEEYNKLKALVQNTHAEKRELRLWAIPDHEAIWRFLIENGVDLINTDHITEFREFILKYDSSEIKQ